MPRQFAASARPLQYPGLKPAAAKAAEYTCVSGLVFADPDSQLRGLVGREAVEQR